MKSLLKVTPLKILFICILPIVNISCASRTIITPVNRSNKIDNSVRVYVNGMKEIGKGRTAFSEIITDYSDPSYIELRKDGCDTKRFDLKRRVTLSRFMTIFASSAFGALAYMFKPDAVGLGIAAVSLLPTLYTYDYKSDHFINYTCIKTKQD